MPPGNDAPARREPRHVTMRHGMAGVRRHGRRAVAFDGVRAAPAGHGPGHGTGRWSPPAALRQVPVARDAARPSLTLEWAVRFW
jgi:hypothetical protein